MYSETSKRDKEKSILLSAVLFNLVLMIVFNSLIFLNRLIGFSPWIKANEAGLLFGIICLAINVGVILVKMIMIISKQSNQETVEEPEVDQAEDAEERPAEEETEAPTLGDLCGIGNGGQRPADGFWARLKNFLPKGEKMKQVFHWLRWPAAVIVILALGGFSLSKVDLKEVAGFVHGYFSAEEPIVASRPAADISDQLEVAPVRPEPLITPLAQPTGEIEKKAETYRKSFEEVCSVLEQLDGLKKEQIEIIFALWPELNEADRQRLQPLLENLKKMNELLEEFQPGVSQNFFFDQVEAA